MHSLIEKLESELKQAQELNYVTTLEFFLGFAVVHFSSHVSDSKIKQIIRHINRTYKDVAWIPGSLYYNDIRKKVKIHYKRDFS